MARQSTIVRRSATSSRMEAVECVVRLADGRVIPMTLHPTMTAWDILRDKYGYTGDFIVEPLGITQV
jgi:hypothetical protein